MARQFRRSSDDDLRMLDVLDERVKNMSKNLEKVLNIHENRLNSLSNNQVTQPCSAHEVRITEIERIVRTRFYLIALLAINILITLLK